MRPYVRMAATAILLWVLLVTLAKGHDFVDLQNDPEMERGLSVQPSESPKDVSLEFQCIRRGSFPVPGSCKDFYQCEELPGYGIMPILFTCPAGTIFDKNLGVCNLPSQVINRADCSDLNRDSARIEDSNNFPTTGIILDNTLTLSRQKRAGPIAVLGVVLTAASLGVGLYNTFKPANVIDISGIENKLTGIQAQLGGMNLQLFMNQIESKVSSKITQNLLKQDLINNQINFKDTQDLIHEGISQSNLNAAIIQGLIVQGNAANEKQFSEAHQSIGKLKEFVRQEMVKIKSEIQKGYTSVSTSIDRVRIEPLVSKLLTLIKEFHSRSIHLSSLPEKNRKDEMEKSGGYIDYLQSTTLDDTLRDIIHQKFAIPASASDTSAVFILGLLVDGLQIQASILSTIVSLNMELASKALNEINLEDFNTYMLRVTSSILKMQLYLGFDTEHSLSKEVNAVINSVRLLPYAYQITGLEELLSEKQFVLEQLESTTNQCIEENTQMDMPGMIRGRPDFRDSSVSIPFGPWESGKRVRYAIQLVSSKTKFSAVGEWSRPYTVSDKANPTIYFPRAKEGVLRLLYRRFNEEKPELVAIVSNNEQTSLKDFGRDLINAASRFNQDLAVTEVQVLLEQDVDVDIALENNMTPLHYAAKYNNVEVMKLLLNRSADIHARSSDNATPLHFASLLDSNDALEYLISEGAQVNEQTTFLGWSPLHIATDKDHVNTAKILIRNNALTNIKDNKGLTPLHLSIQGNGGTMEIMLAENATDVNAQDNEGQTPLHRAARSSTFYSVEQLLKHPEIEVNALSDSHTSPLHCAAMSGNVEIIEELLFSNASLFLADEGGSTPLHYAAFYGNEEAALQLVLRNESLISVKNKNGETALDQAIEFNNKKLISILRDETETPETHETSGNGPPHSADKDETEYTLKDVSCTEQTVQEMAVQSEEICDQMSHIANYIEIIVSQVPIRYNEEEALTAIIDMYNNGLHSAKNNANRWRNRDSILGGIQQTFRLVKAFEGSFNRKYKIKEESILALSNTSNAEEEVKATESMGDISKLKRDINGTKFALAKSTSPEIKDYLLSRIRDLEAELETKEREISTDPTLLLKLEELLYFLETLREEANKIKEKAATTKQRTNMFSANVYEDKELFDGIGQRARSKLKNLERQSLRNNIELTIIHNTREQLEAEVENHKQKVSDLFDDIYITQKELREKRRELLKQFERVSMKKFLAALIAPIFIIAIPLIAQASYEDKLLIERWQENLRKNKAEADRINRLIAQKERLIVQHRETIANSSSNSQTLVRELNTFNKLEYELKNIIVELPSVQPSLEQAKAGLQKIEDVFTHIAQAFAEMIDIGKAAKEAEEIKNALNSIHESLSTLQCNWKGSDLYITDMRSCSKQH